MQVNLEKSELMAETLTLLGFQLTRTGSRPTSKRIEAILKLDKPKNKKGVRRINGILNFIKDYIPNCAGMMRPLANLTRGDVPFHFGDKEDAAFKKIKAKVADANLLTHPDPSRTYVVYPDASQKYTTYGYGYYRKPRSG